MSKASGESKYKKPRNRPLTVSAAKAEGRSLDEFLPLRPAEELLRKHSRSGSFASVGNSAPEKRSRANTVRAAFVRFLILGGDDAAPVSDLVQLGGAYIIGRLVLTGCTTSKLLNFASCHFDEPVSAQAAHLRGLGFSGCRVPGLDADGLRLDGALFLRTGFEASAPIHLTGSRIDGDIDCTDALFQPGQRVAVSLNKAHIAGDLILNRIRVEGAEFSMMGLNLGGSLFCGQSKLENPGGVAVIGTGMRVSGNVGFYEDFESLGEMRLRSAEIGGDLNLQGGQFVHPAGDALNCQGLVVRGGLVWRRVRTVKGCFNLTAASIGSLVDDCESWDAVEEVLLNGFRYDRFLGAQTPTDAAMRVAWLLKQKVSRGGDRFFPGPWEQLVKVLREMGHPEDARMVAIARQAEMRAAGAIGNRHPRSGLVGIRRLLDRGRVRLANSFAKLLHYSYGALAGYGYRPIRVVGWMLVFWLLATLAYSAGERYGLLAPTNPRIYADPAFSACRTGGPKHQYRWSHCPVLPPEHTAFDPTIYSLDVILPLVDLKQESEWMPITHGRRGETLIWGYVLRILMWLEILFGWIGSLLMVSVVGRLVERD